jgi:hypothetical protein
MTPLGIWNTRTSVAKAGGVLLVNAVAEATTYKDHCFVVLGF